MQTSLFEGTEDLDSNIERSEKLSGLREDTSRNSSNVDAIRDAVLLYRSLLYERSIVNIAFSTT